MSFLKKLFSSSKKKPQRQKQPENNNTTETIDLKKVYPRIKGLHDNENPDSIQKDSISEMQVSFSDNPVIRPFAKGIGICYLVDNGNMFQVIQNRHLSDEITIDKLHEAALANMAIAISDKTEVNGDPNNVMIVTNGGNFEATMLLADSLWEQIETVFKDTVCVAIPANDLLFISAKNNPVGRENLRKAVQHYCDHKETKGLLVRHIYERHANGWTFVETV